MSAMSSSASFADPELRTLVALATDAAHVDEVLQRALERLNDVIRYDLAAVLELEGDELHVRCARGRLASHRVRSHRIALSDFPILRQALAARRPTVLTEKDHSHSADPYHGVLDLPDGHSCMVVPLCVRDRTLGAITFDRTQCVPYDDEVVQIANVYAQVVALAMLAAERADDLDRERRRLEEQNRLLEAEVTGDFDPARLMERSRNPAMRRAVDAALQVARSEVPVLLTGETGTGKEVLARLIHARSGRAKEPFVKLNCAALPEGVVESELFGHTKGAFSGADATRPGRFAVANGGTLLLDEVGDLAPQAQAKLLRVLQEGSYEPVGSDYTVHVDVRIIAATHVDLQRAIADGRFRDDLYYRLNVFPIAIPPLRERREDVVTIAEEYLANLRRRTGRGPWRLTREARDALERYEWPGNVRELANCLERAAILHPTGELAIDLPSQRTPGEVTRPTAAASDSPARERRSLADVERAYIAEVLASTRGKIYGPDGAAKILGLKPSTLQNRMKKLGVRRLEAES
jgi:transcriptional regulator with GAF, ATPase, and Fis domain